jgi:UDP-2-acetamido-2-deoxy-ribo-hexuluronate aminotransferase
VTSVTTHPQAPPAGDVVPFFAVTRTVERLWPALAERVEAVLRAGVYVNGPEVAALEGDICRYTGARHAIACGSGTEALVLLLSAAGVGPGAEVIVPCFSFIATATSVSMCGARPVFVDVEPDTYAIDPAGLDAARTPDTAAVMPVHLFTQPADLGAVRAFTQRHGLRLLEDSAEGIGMRYDGVHVGLFGDGGVLSFFPTKTLGALGDAGMVITNDDALAARCRTALAGSGAACLSAMDDLQAAFLRVRLAGLDGETGRRAALARRYDERLAALAPCVRTPRLVRRSVPVTPVYYVYLVEAADKPALVRHLATNGVPTEEYYPRVMPAQPCYRSLPQATRDFPVAARACGRTVALPLYPDLETAEVDRVVELIAGFVRAREDR